MGLLTRAEPGWKEGQNVQEELGITKWEPPAELVMGVQDEPSPDFLRIYTDVEGLRRYPNVLLAEEEVVIAEKIHGANARFLFQEGRLWVGSHKKVKREDAQTVWWRVVDTYNLREKFSRFPNMTFYGEIYGPVQDLRYGVPNNELQLVLFDAMDTKTGTYLDFDDFMRITAELDLPVVPLLYRGPWKEELRSLANGKTMISGGSHVREGFVIRPIKERWDPQCGRVILKLIGEDYLLR